MTPISLVLVNGRIHTGDVRRPMADAVAVAGREFALVGSSAEVRKLAGAAARVVDLRGATVLALTDQATLRRGGPASLVVLAADGITEALRMVDGTIVATKAP